MGLAALLLLCAPAVFDAFDAPLDARRWYVGVPKPPRKGALTVPRDGWLVSRGVADDQVRAIEVLFRHKGGALELAFFTEREPLSSPRGPVILVPKRKGERVLRVTRDGATVDGAALAWEGALRGTFRLRAVKGAVDLLEVRVEPRLPEPRERTALEKRTVLFLTTPQVYTEDKTTYTRHTLMLWDAEVAFLLARGEPSFRVLRAPPKGAPSLAGIITAGDGGALAIKAGAHPLAAREFGDERSNLRRGAYLRYVKETFARLALLQDAQRALNAAVPARTDLEPLVHLAMIRHATEARAAVALADVSGGKRALAALRKELGDTDPSRASADQLRAAAARAARAVLGDVPPQWPGFTFDPSNRFVTIDQVTELAR